MTHHPPILTCTIQLALHAAAVIRLEPPCSAPHLIGQKLLQEGRTTSQATQQSSQRLSQAWLPFLACSEPVVEQNDRPTADPCRCCRGMPSAPMPGAGAGASAPFLPARAQAHDQAADAQPTCCLIARGMLTMHDSFSHQHDACVQTLLDWVAYALHDRTIAPSGTGR